MTINHDRVRVLGRIGRALGSLCVLSLVTGCAPAARELWEDFIGSVGNGHGHGNGGHGGEDPPASCDPIDLDDLFQLINEDLFTQDADDRSFARYLTLANRHDSGLCSSQVREADRRALTKALNMISVSPTIEQPTPIDADLLLYRVDLRDYQWDRPISVGGQTFPDAWEAVAESNPYAVRFAGDDADDAVSSTNTAFPFMLADSFLDTALNGELYYALIDVPEDIDAFILNELGIDVAQNLADQELIRAGSSGEEVGTGNAILAERHDIEVRAGYLWQIADFGADLDALVDDPFGQPQGDRKILFTLPNGLLGFALADESGQRQNDSDQFLDVSQTNFAYSIPASAIAEFAGGVDVEDEVRRGALANPGLSPQEKELVRTLYPNGPQLQAILDDDREQFYSSALTRAGLDIADPEPVGPLLADFDADVDLATAAGDVLVSPEAFAREIAVLPEPVQVLAGGGLLDRDDWTSLYVQSLCIFSAPLENTPDVAACSAAASDP